MGLFMSKSHPLQRAIDQIGLQPLAKELGVTYVAIRKWQAVGRLPRTEWTGETDYAERIARLMDGSVTKKQLLAPWPIFEGKRRVRTEQQEGVPA